MEDASGTKEQIFDVFVEMTAELGFENVSMRDIARNVGINPASIYYHFKNKSQMLELAYDYYQDHQYDNRLSIDEMKRIIKTADANQIVRSFLYTHESEDQKKYVRMVQVIKIVYMRLFQDPIANSLFRATNDDSAVYMIEILEYGKGIGRIDPAFDIKTYAEMFIGAIAIMGINSFANPDYVVRQLDEEIDILALLARLLATALLPLE
ncbi:MAG: TetR/AcrR family transcriptional regulator [Coriobacteriia bacterium]|nr:TetR/AcrR family transcriptional regulator [Coriobacteriia bacterium]